MSYLFILPKITFTIPQKTFRLLTFTEVSVREFDLVETFERFEFKMHNTLSEKQKRAESR